MQNQLFPAKSGENAKEATRTIILTEQEVQSQPLVNKQLSFSTYDLTSVEEFPSAEKGVEVTPLVVEDVKPKSEDLFASGSSTSFQEY